MCVCIHLSVELDRVVSEARLYHSTDGHVSIDPVLGFSFPSPSPPPPPREQVGGSCTCRLASILERYKDVPLHLKLSENKLTELPSVLYMLTRLEVRRKPGTQVYVEWRELDHHQDAGFSLQGQGLDLSRNRIRRIPWDDLTLRFQTLRRLDVSGNELEPVEQKRAQLFGESRSIQVTS